MPPLRPLLPAAEGYQRTSPTATPSTKQKVSAACHSCRKSKKESRQIRQRYAQLQKQESTHEKLIGMIRSMPEQDVAEIVRRLKAGMDAASIVSFVRDGNLLMQLSLTPETSRRYEFPLVTAMPYHLYIGGNPYLDSPYHRSLFPHSASGSEDSSQRTKVQGVDKDNRRAADDEIHPSAYELPYHTTQMIEPLMEKVTAAPWTKVISDDRLFRRLISSYFCYPHPCGPFVHKDLFLEDMAAGRTNFCSPLLANAMLANACQSCSTIPDRSKVWLPESLTYRFTAEARRLWDLESLPGRSKIPTIQAALILSYNSTNNGLDEIGTIYARRACEMSQDLGLFGPEEWGAGTKMEKARLFTAWAVFSWQAMFDYYFFRRPYFSQPPQMPLPNPRLHSDWYGEVSFQYPRDPRPMPLSIGYKFYCETALHKIINDIGLLTFGRPSAQMLTLDELAVIKRELDKWKNLLPEAFQPEKVVLPSHLMLHVQYWQIVKAIAQLMVKAESVERSKAAALWPEKSPQSSLHEARIMLETASCIYYARHGFEFYDPWVAFTLTIIGNTVIDDLKAGSIIDPRILAGYRSLLILSAQGLASQSHHYHNGTLLATQLQSAMSPQDLQLACTHVKEAGMSKLDQLLVAEHSQSHWPLPDKVAINEDPEKVKLNTLLQGIEEIQLQQCEERET
ncbi:hypothetical protein COCMIDRAFT_38896 [Bipolaris oryzae ATCC 44560]|uniref:Xylanolytic transcriptional activator regulatory domain-containing protein n=1 Tax=Bipolaris oryzae ATCC 44560 TaxID=930090 RepID=W6ZHR7_COCMI|nr:uncharacterized protein COCMIDRAFT_38896 [Bipolaris oryzae ATCC 44560]EUC43101.1 hypothetical protein COCMIDRAFT_38896 [Bipolaris oryzae ATCC 44560]